MDRILKDADRILKSKSFYIAFNKLLTSVQQVR